MRRAGDNPPEGLSEEGVEDGVDDRVQSGVQVAQPCDEVDDLRKNIKKFFNLKHNKLQSNENFRSY